MNVRNSDTIYMQPNPTLSLLVTMRRIFPFVFSFNSCTDVALPLLSKGISTSKKKKEWVSRNLLQSISSPFLAKQHFVRKRKSSSIFNKGKGLMNHPAVLIMGRKALAWMGRICFVLHRHVKRIIRVVREFGQSFLVWIIFLQIWDERDENFGRVWISKFDFWLITFKWSSLWSPQISFQLKA